MKRLFPLTNIKNIRLFYFLTVVNNGWFINANWIFLALSLMSKSQLGLVDGGSFLIGTLVDLPSGAIADIIGRRKTIVISRFLFAVSCLILALSFNVWIFAIGNILFFIGHSFYAGADQALLYDSLKNEGEVSSYLNVSTKLDMISRVATLVSSVVGAWAFLYGMRYPFYLIFIFATISFFVSLKLEEVEPEEARRKFNLANFIDQQSRGIKVLVSTNLKYYLPLFFVFLGTFVMFGWGILRGFMAIVYGFGGTSQSILFGLLSFATGLIGLVLPKIVSKSSDYKVTLVMTILFTVGFGMFGFYLDSKFWGLIVLLLISIGGGVMNILSQKVVNDEVSSNLRATALSALSIVTKIPYILFAYIIGVLADANNLAYGTWTIVAVCLISIVLSVYLKSINNEKYS